MRRFGMMSEKTSRFPGTTVSCPMRPSHDAPDAPETPSARPSAGCAQIAADDDVVCIIGDGVVDQGERAPKFGINGGQMQIGKVRDAVHGRSGFSSISEMQVGASTNMSTPKQRIAQTIAFKFSQSSKTL